MYFSCLEIEINSQCNRSCSYCPNSVSKRKEEGEMKPELFLKIMTDLQAISYAGSLSFQFYNEPLLALKLDWFVETARSYLPRSKFLLYSNGTLLTIDRFRTLRKLGINKFIVTKHASVGSFEFERTWVMMREEEKTSVDYRHYTDLTLTNRGGAVNAGPQNIPPLLPCFIPEFLTVITVKGHVLPCFEDYHQELIMGDVSTEPLKDIWNSKKYSLFRSNLKKGLRHLEGPCKKCNRLEVLQP